MPSARASASDRPSAADLAGRRVQVFCLALLGLGLVGLLIVRWASPPGSEAEIPLFPERIALVETRVDPNTATWAELARLPEIGEVTARSIVAYRERLRSEAGDPALAVFRSVEDLDPVERIGPKTLAVIAPYLKFPEDAEVLR